MCSDLCGAGHEHPEAASDTYITFTIILSAGAGDRSSCIWAGRLVVQDLSDARGRSGGGFGG